MKGPRREGACAQDSARARLCEGAWTLPDLALELTARWPATGKTARSRTKAHSSVAGAGKTKTEKQAARGRRRRFFGFAVGTGNLLDL